MGLVRRVVEDEPEEAPTQFGRHLLRIAREDVGKWVAAYESENRSRVVYLEGCLIGRGKGRIGGVRDITGWEARVVEHDPDGSHPATWWELRVRYSGPVKDGQQQIPAVASGKGVDPTMERLRRGEHVEP